MDQYSYTYDEAGNQLSKYEVIGGSEKGATAYAYDELNRLLSVTEPDGRVNSYLYDSIGNRTKEAIENGADITENNYSYNDQNCLTSITSRVNNEIIKITGYIYDSNGNQTTTIVENYEDGELISTVNAATNTYDYHNQLIKIVTEDGTVIQNSYNADGFRTEKEVNGETTYYLYEGNELILEVDEAKNQIARNVYGTNLLKRTVEAESYYYLYNGHADVTALIENDGTILAVRQ